MGAPASGLVLDSPHERRARARLVIVLIGTAALGASASGCDASSPDSARALEQGTIGLTLSLPGVTVQTVRFDVVGNGVMRAGEIAVGADGATASALVGGLPAGKGFTVSLSAATADGQTTCAGMTKADVVADATTAVSVSLQCRTTSNLGAVMGSGHFTFCPEVTSLAATPGAGPLVMTSTAYEETLDVVAIARDLDGSALTFAWASDVGRFDDPSRAQTVYHCDAPGRVTVSVSVSDGDCQQTVIATLVCLPFCASKADGTACNDENACTRSDRCQSGICAGNNPVVCGAVDQCHVAGTCNPQSGVCSTPAAPDSTGCDDGNACTHVDHCQGGRCSGGVPMVCLASDQCHVAGTCDPTGGLCSDLAAADLTACQLPGAEAACMGGACAVTACRAGVGDCNRVAADGCETALTSNANCGTCGHGCVAGTACVSGLCLSPPPTAVTAVAGGWKTTLSWAPAPAATGYEVFRGPSMTGPFAPVANTADTRLVDVSAATGTSYYVVRARNAEGVSASSVPLGVTALPKQICVTDTLVHSVLVFDATQSGAAAPVRVVVGPSGTLRWPTDVAASLSRDELFVVRRGGQIDVLPLAAGLGAVPARSFFTAVPGGFSFTLGVDEIAGELYTVDYVPGRPGGRVLALDAVTGVATRLISGDNPHLGHPAGLAIDHAHGEVLIGITGDPEPSANFARIQAFDIAAVAGGGGDIAPKRVLGAPGMTSLGGWAIAHDRARDQIYTSCDCDNRITVFDRTAIGNAAPLRTLQLPAPYVSVYALLMDEGADAVWVMARNLSSTYGLLQMPRGANGSVAPARPAVQIDAAGRLAPCN